MRKTLFFLFALLMTIGIRATDVTVANTSSGSLPSAFGSFASNVFTTSAASGLEGVTVTGSSGLTIGEATVNVASYGKCFSLVTAAAATNYKVTMAVPDGYVITGYYLDCSANTSGAPHTLTSEDGTVSVVASAPPYNNPTGPKAFEVTGLNTQTTYFTINTANKGNTLYLPTFTISVQKIGVTYVNVTYELYESDGTTLISNTTTEQEINSAINVPASFTSNTYYTYTTEGSIGETDCTIKVIRTLKSDIVYPISNLSNNKAYSIVVPRGTYTTDNGSLANTVKSSSYTINNFALVSYEDNYYMWSIADSKFVAGSGATLSDTPAAITFSATTVPAYQIKCGSNTLNATSGQATGATFDSWSDADDGNRCVIYEAADFDPTNVLAALEDYFHGTAAFNTAITQLETIAWGTGLGQYSLVIESTDYTSQATTIISGLKAAGYSTENLAVAQQMLNSVSLNMPKAGTFLRIKGNTSDKYLAAGLASNNKFAMTDATDNTTLFYFDGTKLINMSSGKFNGMSTSAWAWVDESSASTVAFHDGLTNGGYAIQSAAAYFYDNGDNSSSADRGGNLIISTSTNARYTSWSLEESTTFDVAMHAGESTYWATANFPFGYTIPSGTEAYIGQVDGNCIKLSSIGTSVPAATPVILNGDATSITVTIDNTVTTDTESNGLSGQYAADNAANESKLSLGISNGKVGFYTYDGALGAFKAYLTASTGSNGFTFSFADDDVTGISEIVDNESSNSKYFDLQGRKVAAPQKGQLYIKGGKIVKY